MFIQALPSGPFETNAYIVACEETKQAAIVDPGVKSFKKITTLLENKNFTPTIILLTHSHWDHIADVSKLKEHYGIEVMIHPEDAENLLHPGSDGLPMWTSFPGVAADKELTEGVAIQIGNLTWIVIHTPGHTPGGICLYCKSENALLSGDTLFKQSIGNISFPTAEPSKMWDSLKKLEILPENTKVYPGHGPSTTIGEESWLPNAKELFDG